jgi:hypothetical protein
MRKRKRKRKHKVYKSREAVLREWWRGQGKRMAVYFNSEREAYAMELLISLWLVGAMTISLKQSNPWSAACCFSFLYAVGLFLLFVIGVFDEPVRDDQE